MYDINLLVENSDSQEVADAIGLRTLTKGKNTYCECPSHRKFLGRNDNNISNCVLTPHGYVCFACGAKGNVINMIMDYCDISFPDAVKKLAGITGGSFCIESNSAKKQPFSSEDLALIGLSSLANPKGDAGKEILGVSRFKPESAVCFRRGDEYVTYSSAKRITLYQLFCEDEKLYYELISDNARIALGKYEALYRSFDSRGSETFSKIFEYFSKGGELDERVAAEIKNVLLLNIRRTKRILEEAEAKS